MKLAAIYCVWDDWDLFFKSRENISKLVDGVILVWSQTSNFGEFNPADFSIYKNSFLVEPDLNLPPAENERAKRNFGLDKARELGYTHFIMADADEMYESEPFLKEKERIDREDIDGTVCRVKTYFRTPTLTIG